MGDRNTTTMPGRRIVTTNDPSSSSTDEDQYYMVRMREILNGFPNTGPPTYPVQILDHVYMGNQRNADNIELLRRYGITHVINCAGQRRFDFTRSPYPKESGIKGFLMISAEDSEDFDIARHFDEAITFLDRVKKAKGKALVHCNLGVNRSGAIVAAYLMADQKRTLLDVINYLKVKRFVVLSNKGFRRQLILFARSRGLLDPVIRCPTSAQENQYGYTLEQCTARDRERRGQKDEADGKAATLEEKQEIKQGASYQMTYITNTLSSNSVDRKNDTKKDKPKIGDLSDVKKVFSPSPLEEIGVRNRLWTLPRYGRSQDQQSVEVIVSEHKEIEKSTISDRTETKSRSKVVQPLLPVYETRSCDAGGSSSSGSRLTAAESVSAKLSGFLNLLGPKKPLRSTSYSNVSTSQSTASSTTGNASSSSTDDPSSGSSLSTARPLRIYTRSCTDSEIYRTRQGGNPTAGQLRLPRPASKP